MTFDHIGIVIGELAAGRELLNTTFGVRQWTREFEDPVNGVRVQFGRCGSPACYELIAPLTAASPVWSVLNKGVNMINHVAYLVGDLAPEAARLKARGFTVIGRPKPAVAYGGKLIQFFASPSGLLFELIEAPNHQHEYLP